MRSKLKFVTFSLVFAFLVTLVAIFIYQRATATPLSENGFYQWGNMTQRGVKQLSISEAQKRFTFYENFSTQKTRTMSGSTKYLGQGNYLLTGAKKSFLLEIKPNHTYIFLEITPKVSQAVSVKKMGDVPTNLK